MHFITSPNLVFGINLQDYSGMILHVLNLSPASQIYRNFIFTVIRIIYSLFLPHPGFMMNPVTDKLPIARIGLFVAC